MKPGTLAAFIFFILIAVAHLWRLVYHVEVIVGRHVVPMWVSFVALIIACGLAVMLWRELRPE